MFFVIRDMNGGVCRDLTKVHQNILVDIIDTYMIILIKLLY